MLAILTVRHSAVGGKAQNSPVMVRWTILKQPPNGFRCRVPQYHLATLLTGLLDCGTKVLVW